MAQRLHRHQVHGGREPLVVELARIQRGRHAHAVDHHKHGFGAVDVAIAGDSTAGRDAAKMRYGNNSRGDRCTCSHIALQNAC